MKKRSWLFVTFLLVAFVQLFVPAQLIWNREEILETGKDYQFRTAPIDPNDPFRGKYVALRFEENWVEVRDPEGWKNEEEIYVLLKTDSQGFVKATGVSKSEPAAGSSFVKAKVEYVSNEKGLKKLYFNYPFDRFYLEESLAKEAEETYVETQQDSMQIAYALVKIKDGDAVLKDVFIDSVSIIEIVKARQVGK
jgi:uncharacterized membrane-anchored protein